MTTTSDPSQGGTPQQQQTPSDSFSSRSSDANKTWLSQDTSPNPTPTTNNNNNNNHTKRPRLSEVTQSIKPEDFLKVHQAPCARQGFMTGIGGGVAVMGLRWMTGSPVMRAANWGVGTFVAASMGGWEWCRYQRRQEHAKMRRVVEVYDRKKAEKKKEEEEEKARRKKALEKQREEEEERRRRRWGWKFW